MDFVERIDRIAGFIDRPLWYVCWVLLCVLTILTNVAVVQRYIFGISYMWLDELSRYIFIALILLWGGPIIRKGEHIRLDIFTNILGKRATHIHSLIVNIIACFICLMILDWGIFLIRTSWMLNEKSQSFVFSIWLLHTLVAVGMGLYAFYSFLEILKAIASLFPTKERIK